MDQQNQQEGGDLKVLTRLDFSGNPWERGLESVVVAGVRCTYYVPVGTIARQHKAMPKVAEELSCV